MQVRFGAPEPEQDGWNPDRLTVVLQMSGVSMKAITLSILLLAAALSPAQGKRDGTAEKPFAAESLTARVDKLFAE